MTYDPFPEVTCARCGRVFSVAGTVAPDWICEDCQDVLAQDAVEAQLTRWHGGATWPTQERDR